MIIYDFNNVVRSKFLLTSKSMETNSALSALFSQYRGLSYDKLLLEFNKYMQILPEDIVFKVIIYIPMPGSHHVNS